MTSEIELPKTPLGLSTAYELSTRRLRGKSMEFRSISDKVVDGMRTITEARYFGEGVVDKPAYPGSVAQMRSWDDYMAAMEYRVEPSGLAVPEPCPRRPLRCPLHS